MSTATLTPAQQHLLKLFSYNNTEAYALEIQAVLTRYFQGRLDAKSDELWDSGVLDQKRGRNTMCVTNEILEEYAEVIERMTDHEFAELAVDVIINNP